MTSEPHSRTITVPEDALREELLKLIQERDGLKEQLEAAQKERHVQNLEWAISLAESDPLYAEIFRPYFQKIVDALVSNPASELEAL